MAGISQNTVKHGFSVISGRNSGEIEGEFDEKLCKTKPISDYPCVFELAVYNLLLRDGNLRNFDGEFTKWQKHQKQMQ